MATFNIHAGHNPDGKAACGAIGLIKESTENRRVKDLVIKQLKSQGHTVYDCTVNDGKNKNDVLQKIITKCNSHKVDLDVSIHFNSGATDRAGNGKSAGTEVLIYDLESKALNEAKRTVEAIASLGFRNRGVITRPGLYVLRRTKSPAMLIECCFVDDKDDVKLYDPGTMAEAIVYGITGKRSSEYRVRINTKDLNVRKGPGTTYGVETVVHKNEVFTIVETSGKWGKLKSGAGWISLLYTEKA